MELQPEDIEYLVGQFGDSGWEWLQEPGASGILIPNYPVPVGYGPDQADLMLLIPEGYPASGIDMFYFDPHVKRLDGHEIHALAVACHFGRNWQMWSRHYEWRPGIDNISTHLTVMRNQLQSELPATP